MTKSQLSQQKRDISQRVVTATMHLLHDSNLHGSSLWPKGGMLAGYSDYKSKDTLFIACNAYGFAEIPCFGRMMINIGIAPENRIEKQFNQIELIISDAVYDNIYFELEVNNTQRFMWFKFTENGN